jgi:hypothetical protein
MNRSFLLKALGLLVATLCVAFSLYAQDPTWTQDYRGNVQYKGLSAAQYMQIPSWVDTNFIPATNGFILLRTADGKPYIFINHWVSFANGGGIPSSGFDTLVATLDSVGLLKTMYVTIHHAMIRVLGYALPSDGGAGDFWLNDTNTLPRLPGMIEPVTGHTNLAWMRTVKSTQYSLMWFGGQVMVRTDTTTNGTPLDTATDNIIAIKNAFNYFANYQHPYTQSGLNAQADLLMGSTLQLPPGAFRISDSFSIPQAVNIRGAGEGSTLLVFDFESGHTRPAGSRSGITCYGGGSAGTGIPNVTTGSFGHNQISDLSITSTIADNGHGAVKHFTAKNLIELRNGFYGLSRMHLSCGDSSGLMMYCLIRSMFDELTIDGNGTSGIHLTYDPANPTNPTTTTTFRDVYTRETRRGPGVLIDGPVISTSWYNSLSENNGKEDSTKGWGIVLLGDSTATGWSHFNMKVAFYSQDLERNMTGKMLANYAAVQVDENLRYTGQPYSLSNDWVFRNSYVSLKPTIFQTNVNPFFGLPEILVQGTDSTKSFLDLDMPNMTVSAVKFTSFAGAVYPYYHMPYLRLKCVQANGVGNISYMGYLTSNEGFNMFGRDSSWIQTPLTIGAAVSARAGTILDLQSSTKTVELPVLTPASQNAIATPLIGEIHWNSGFHSFVDYNGTNWQAILHHDKNGNVGVNMGSSTPTWELDLGNIQNGGGSNKGWAIEAGGDDSVNLSRLTATISANRWYITSASQLSGTTYPLSLGLGGTAVNYLNFWTAVTNGAWADMGRNVSTSGSELALDATWINPSGLAGGLLIDPSITATGTASGAGIWMSPQVNSTGSGNYDFIRLSHNSGAGVSGNDSLYWRVDLNGQQWSPKMIGTLSNSVVPVYRDTVTGELIESWNSAIDSIKLFNSYNAGVGNDTMASIIGKDSLRIFALKDSAATGMHLLYNPNTFTYTAYYSASGLNWIGNTITVTQGGTGLTTLTSYAIMAGGTTSTGNLQQVSGVGTTGQVLTSNGASALPTWQAASGGGGSVNTSVGAGYRWVVWGTNNVKSFTVGLGELLDSATSNQLNLKVDTTYVNTKGTNQIITGNKLYSGTMQFNSTFTANGASTFAGQVNLTGNTYNPNAPNEMVTIDSTNGYKLSRRAFTAIDTTNSWKNLNYAPIWTTANSDFTMSPVATIAGSGDGTAMTSAVGGLASATAPSSGTAHSYLVSGYINATAASSTSLQMIINYTDENNNSRSFNLGSAVTSVSANPFTGVEIRVKSGTGVGISVTSTGGTATYDAGGTISFLR